MNRIRKNDMVYVIAGKDRGKTGKVVRVDFQKRRAMVEGINYVKKAVRRTREDQAGGVIKRESSIESSNLMLFCAKCHRPTRIAYSILADGTKQRQCKRCGELL